MDINRRDILRTMLIGSSVFILVSTFYAVFLHAQYTGQINGIRLDLISISNWYNSKAQKATGTDAIKFKQIANTADDLSKQITGPSLNPYAYTYLNYWVSSAAFTNLLLTYKELGLNNKTISALNKIDSMNWFDNSSFYIFDLSLGSFTQKLASRPRLEAYFWTYYIGVILTAILAVWLGMKKKYDNPITPGIVAGALSLIPFWVVFLVGSLIAMVFGSLRPENVDFGAYLVSLIITIALSSFSGMIVGIIKRREEK